MENNNDPSPRAATAAGETANEPALRDALQDLLILSECADETGYVADVGFMDVDAIHAKAHAALEAQPADAGTEDGASDMALLDWLEKNAYSTFEEVASCRINQRAVSFVTLQIEGTFHSIRDAIKEAMHYNEDWLKSK